MDAFSNAQDHRADRLPAATVHENVSVGHQLTSGSDAKPARKTTLSSLRSRKPIRPSIRVRRVQTARLADEAAQLLLTQSVMKKKLLLFSELGAELGGFALAGSAVLPGG